MVPGYYDGVPELPADIKAELKGLMPEDARQAVGHGVKAKRSKSGSASFALGDAEDGSDAAV